MKKMTFIIAAFLLTVGLAQVRATTHDLGAIWFIGDSITQGNSSGDYAGSPRKSLYDLLTANGYTFTYTGHYSINTTGLPATGAAVADNLYHYHSGISGSVIGDNISNRTGITQNVATFWESGRLDLVKPNIILIMLGANDIGSSIDVANAPARLKTLLRTIYDLPGVGSPSIYLASITPNRRDATQTANAITFNTFVPGIVSEFQAEGKDIHFVDQFTPMNDDYANLMRSDNLHPTVAGNDVLAQTWFNQITVQVTADISAVPLSGAVPLTVDFDASGSVTDSGIVSYSWNFGDGTTGSGIAPSHTYTDGGTYQAVLVATSASNQTGVASVEITTTEWEGTLSDFYGYDLYSFTTNGMDCKVAVPETIAEGKPWVWRARFWGHQAAPDVALLGEGYHIAYVDVAGLFGSPTAVARFDTFYDFLTVEHNFDTRTVLEGMSHGGLAIYNWAAQNPDKVHCVYADAPVCDFKSWPGGLYDGDGSASSWAACLSAYGFTEADALAYGGNPVDNMQPLAEAGIPLLHVVGDIDTVVPVAENTALAEERYKTLGGWIEVIHKPGVGHVHGLAYPAPIIDFILNGMNYIHNLEATGVTDTTATLNGLLSLPGTNYEVQVHWGLSDGGTDADAWDSNASMGSWETGDANLVSYDISALEEDSTYYYSFSASNENGLVWDDALSVQVSSVTVDGISTNIDLAYGSFVSATDLVNAGAASLASGPSYSTTPDFGAAANNDGTLGTSSTDDITFWTDAVGGDTYTITYALDTAVNPFGYDITSLQTIHGGDSNSGNQKNQNYMVEVSTIDTSGFVAITSVAYLPFSPENEPGSSKVIITAIDSGLLASNVDEIRFTYTVPESGGTYPGPAIREIDVFGAASATPINLLYNIISFNNNNSTSSQYWIPGITSIAVADGITGTDDAGLVSLQTIRSNPETATSNTRFRNTEAGQNNVRQTLTTDIGNGNQYFQFGIVANAGKTIDLNSLSFLAVRATTSSSTRGYNIDISIDGGPYADLAAADIANNRNNGLESFNFPLSHAGITSVDFRIYSTGGGIEWTNFKINGVLLADVQIPQFSTGTSVSNGNLFTQFTGSIGSHYQVEYSDDLTTNSWQTVTDVVALAASPMVVELSATNSIGFYRVIGFP